MVEPDPRRLEGLGVARLPLLADPERGSAGDVGDALVPEHDEMLGRHLPAQVIVDLDDRDRRRVDVAVEADDREAVPHEPRQPVRGQDEPVDEGAVDLLRL